MARVVRKVSNRAVSGQKKQKNLIKNKWIWIIPALVVVIVVVSVVLAVVLPNNNEVEGNKIDYFENQEVEFTKASYAGLQNYTNLNYINPQNENELFVENVFIFAYNLSSFYPDSNDESYDKKHAQILTLLVDLQKSIDEQKNNGVDVELLIIDTSIGLNADVLMDSAYGGSENEDDAVSFIFSYIRHGEIFTDEIKNERNYSLNSTDLSTMITTTIPTAQYFVSSGLNPDLIVKK